MSQENVEIVQAAFAAWNVGDMDALRELYDPDAILRMPRVGRSRGHTWAERRSCASGRSNAKPSTPTHLS
jgi:ketosteroid isomerase-like protein